MFTELYASLLDWNGVPTTLLIVIIFFLCLKCRQQHDTRLASLYKKLQQNNFKPMPSPPTVPIIGHIHLLRDHQHNPWDGFEEIRKQFGDVVSLKMGIHPMALVSSSDTMKEILLEKGDIFSDRPNFSRHHIIFGGDKENSLALCDWSNIHRDRRKLCKRGIAPSRFSSRNQLLETIISKFVAQFISNISKQRPIYVDSPSAQLLTTTTSQNSETSPQERKCYFKTTKEDILFLTSDIFMEFLCSENHSHSDPEYRKFVNGCDFIFWDINQSYLIDFLPFLTSLGLGFTYLKRLKRVSDFLRDYIDEKIFEPRRMKYIKLNDQVNRYDETLTDNDDNLDSSEDYLNSVIIEHLAQITSMSLADYKVGFADLLAGHAAVANILMRLLGHLALNQKIQDMIFQEARDVDIYNLKHKPSLPITEAAMHEALRIASSPIVPHVAREDTSIDEFYVPKGTMILFNNYHLNLSENLWTNPLEFDPVRFLEQSRDSSGKISYKLNIPKHFTPFSIGKRQCLGYKMVETTTIVTVANICRKFIIKADNEDLVKLLVAPIGSVALNPDADCFKLNLYLR